MSYHPLKFYEDLNDNITEKWYHNNNKKDLDHENEHHSNKCSGNINENNKNHNKYDKKGSKEDHISQNLILLKSIRKHFIIFMENIYV